VIGAVGIIAAGAFALVRQGDPAGDASETNKGAPRVNSASRRLALPAKTLEVQGYFVSLAAGDGKAVPLIYQPKSCTKALVWDAVREKVTRVQPWPKCSTARARAVRLAAGWDSYRFSGAIARNLLTLAVRWNISDSCGGILNRVVFPHRTGETLGTYLSGCLYVGEFESSETAVGGFARGGRAVYYNVWRARAGQGRRVTIIAEHPYDPKAYEFPALDAALDDTGLFYALSWMPQSDDMWPYGEGRVMFVSAEALEAGLPSG
jgi:hypothetical protein